MTAKAIIDSTFGPEETESTRTVNRRGEVVWRNKDGEYHRIDGPAVVRDDGTIMWYKNGCYHRVGGPAITYSDGSKMWFVNGQRHREDGPAVDDADGQKEWWLKDKRHRLDGPALVFSSGREQYWVNGQQFNKDEFIRFVDPVTGEIFLPPGRKLYHDY
jgi:hypothetical protein